MNGAAGLLGIADRSDSQAYRRPVHDRELVRELSEALVDLQRPIRVLDAIAWGDEIRRDFLAGGARQQPAVDVDYYRTRPLGFEPAELRDSFDVLGRDITKRLGAAPVALLLSGRVEQYRRVIDMLEARGTPAFSGISADLYGRTSDRLHSAGPTLASLGRIMNDALANIDVGSWEPPMGVAYRADEAVRILEDRLAEVFVDREHGVRVVVDDGIVADAAAGSDYIKLREDATFTGRDLRVLEVHEGWVHVATSLNGRLQPWCTFLGKGTPATTATQEGLAVFTEITTLSSTPDRLRKVTRRMSAIGMAEQGATFLDVYRWHLDDGVDEPTAWSSTVRVFRGSSPVGGPFTKDLVYSRGFIEVYDFMRLAVRRGLVDRLPLLFAGKLAIDEIGVVAHLVEDGLVVRPRYLPPHVADVSALASWMAYSNLLNRIDLDRMEDHLAPAFE